MRRVLKADVSRIVSRSWLQAVKTAVPRNENPRFAASSETGATGLEPATSGVTGRRSNQLNYAPRRSGSVPERFVPTRSPRGVTASLDA